MQREQSVSIVIPFKNKLELLHDCLNTMEAALGEEIANVELVLVDNGSDPAELRQFIIPAAYQYTLLSVDRPFNFQTLINRGVAAASGRFVLLLNNDIVFTAQSNGFLKKMRQQAELANVGAVGALLLYPDQTIQHAGVVVGMNHYADHLYRGWTKAQASRFPFSSYADDRYVSAVTAACLMVERAKFDAVGGMDERFTVCGGDVDLCIRLTEAGYQNVYLGSVELIHLESKSRDAAQIPEGDFVESSRSYSSYLKRFNGRDPYYPEPLPLLHGLAYEQQLDVIQKSERFRRFKAQVKQKLKHYWAILKSEPIEIGLARLFVTARRKLSIKSGLQAPEGQITTAHLKIPHMQPVRFHTEAVLNPQPRFNILLPHLIESGIYGGILTAALIGLKFKQKYGDVPVRFLLTDSSGSPEALKKKLKPYIGPSIEDLDVTLLALYDRQSFSANIHDQDYFLATAWWTCYSAEKLSKRPFLYLIQDFEPCFYPWGEEYACALATYHMNFIPVFNTSILKDFFVNQNILPQYQADAGAVFEPAISRILFSEKNHYLNQSKTKRVLFFYGRPLVARNLFSTGILGITEAVRRGILNPKEWEIISAGELHPTVQIQDDLVIRSIGKVSLEEYAQILQTVDVGVSLMLSPHPSYPPLEIAASGALCVTNYYGTKDLSQYHSNIISCEPSIAGVVEGIQAAVERLEHPHLVDIQPIDKLVYDWDISLETTLEKIYQIMHADQ